MRTALTGAKAPINLDVSPSCANADVDCVRECSDSRCTLNLLPLFLPPRALSHRAAGVPYIFRLESATGGAQLRVTVNTPPSHGQLVLRSLHGNIIKFGVALGEVPAAAHFSGAIAFVATVGTATFASSARWQDAEEDLPLQHAFAAQHGFSCETGDNGTTVAHVSDGSSRVLRSFMPSSVAQPLLVPPSAFILL